MRYLSVVLMAISITAHAEESSVEWDMQSLSEAQEIADEIGTMSFVVQSGGEVVYTYGDVDRPTLVRSIRKAILSTLVFQHLDKIDLNATLDELGIDDAPIPLTDLQRQTRVIHLLKSTSGIHHPAGSTNANMRRHVEERLGTRQNEPGTIWAYNNWDYNALTTIFEQQTGMPIEKAFREGLAGPLGIPDFEVFYRKDEKLSQHPKAGFRLSSRDLARFGQLMLNRGTWNGQQIVPAEWIDKITSEYTLTNVPISDRYGHGYLWWIPSPNYAGGLPEGSFMANGAQGQKLLVIPGMDIVIAHNVKTDMPPSQRTPVSADEFEGLVAIILEGRVAD